MAELPPLNSLHSTLHHPTPTQTSCTILLFFFCHFPSIPKPAVIPTVRGCCLAAPDLWNDDRGAWAPYPSVFVTHPQPPPPCTHTSTYAHTFHHHLHNCLPHATLSYGCGHSWRWQMFLVRQGWRPPPEVISALASTCWLGPLARCLHVRGQVVIEGTATQSQEGRTEVVRGGK